MLHRRTESRRYRGTQATPARTVSHLNVDHTITLLGLHPEPELNDIAELASSLCWSSDGFVTLNNQEWIHIKGVSGRYRQWIGVRAARIPLVETFCQFTLKQDDPLVIADATADPRFASMDVVTKTPGMRFYAGASFAGPDGNRIGTVCVTDTIPRQLKDWQQRALHLLAERVSAHIELRFRRMESL